MVKRPTAQARGMHILRHALGRFPSQADELRNHFIAVAGTDDWRDCERLCGIGLLARTIYPTGFSSCCYYYATELGIGAALEYEARARKSL